ncbi:MAG: FtsW/RodA/SpoVE family cell cycle protein [Erysipelotrichaceae bacterium]|nr:FtsW/RodA/SpoVE family cell cycle protein [Erysipelotrichaceae bacterium]MDD3923641.1 FtsW/RodA/SpoVE family cell cycle protein [Erysipelotrichaceae bacterium]MDD4641996.1 FtsW/RodA/SpoVE family cell cycle protein [Erysipelotrichaceae bacterium]
MKTFIRSFLIQPKRTDKVIYITILLLGIFGLIMQTSASMFSTSTFSLFSLLKITFKQIMFLIAGHLIMVYFSNRFTYDKAQRNIFYIMITILVLLIATRFFQPAGGSYAWIRLNIAGFSISLQPSEFAKIAIVIVMAIYLGDKKYNKWQKLIIVPFSFFAIAMILIAIYQKDLGTALIFMLITFFCFMIPANRGLRTFQIIALLLAIIFVFLMYYLTTSSGIELLRDLNISEYQLTRFIAVENPFYDKFGKGFFDLNNSLIGFSRGELFGVGLGKSILKYSNISAASTDFIMEVIVEELGLMGFMYVFLGYIIIVYRLIRHALYIKSEKGKIIIIGVMMYFVLHFIFNVGGITCLLPLTGVPLLLISSGGSSTVAAMMAIGIAQAIINQEKNLVRNDR